MKNNKIKGITLISLVVTIIVLLILSGVSIAALTGNNSIINNAALSKISVDYSQTNEALETYKLREEEKAKLSDEITDEKLVGKLYKKVFVNDTKRELGVIVDFKILNIEPSYGKGAKKLLEDCNNDMESTLEIDTIYDLVNIYAVDLSDGTLYYINGSQIYSQSSKTEVAENENLVMKYKVEILNNEYIQRAKFITKWDVTLGETSGSETYSTVKLPASTSGVYDATIYWGDGTNTVIKHKKDGVTLTSSQLTELVTHEYTIEEGEDTIKTIEISGLYSRFNCREDTPTANKLTQIMQWGNIGLKELKFNTCTNLSGSIPSPNIDNCFKNCTSFGELFENTKITGIVPKNLFDSAINCTSFSQAFSGSKIEGLEDGFKLPSGVTAVDRMFNGCKSLETLPETFILPNTVTNVTIIFRDCRNLKQLPSQFKIPEGVTSLNLVFGGCSALSKLPDGFTLPSTIESLSRCFDGCSSLEYLPDNFTIPQGVTNLNGTFNNCSKLKSLPTNFSIPDSVTDMGSTFGTCSSLESLPSGFTIPASVTTTYSTYHGKGIFEGCKKLKGYLTVQANLTDYTKMFSQTSVNSGGTLTVNYSSNCSNIDDIIATGDSNYIIKGNLVE